MGNIKIATILKISELQKKNKNGGGGILERTRLAFGVSNPRSICFAYVGFSSPASKGANKMEAGGFEGVRWIRKLSILRYL